MEVLLPFVQDHDCSLLAMCVGGGVMPQTAPEVFEAARLLIEKTAEVGLKPEDLYIDVAVMAVAVNASAARRVMESIRLIREYEPRVHTVCAVSNVSFGLPRRRLLNRTFIPMLAGAGADTFIVDVRDNPTMAAVTATEALLGNDEFCMNYMRAYRDGRL